MTSPLVFSDEAAPKPLHIHCLDKHNCGAGLLTHLRLHQSTLRNVVVSSSGMSEHLFGDDDDAERRVPFGSLTFSDSQLRAQLMPKELEDVDVSACAMLKPDGPCRFVDVVSRVGGRGERAVSVDADSAEEGNNTIQSQPPPFDIFLCADVDILETLIRFYATAPAAAKVTHSRRAYAFTLSPATTMATSELNVAKTFSVLMSELLSKAQQERSSKSTSAAKTAAVAHHAAQVWEDAVDSVITQFSQLRRVDVLFCVLP